jgi:thiosulfate/3-mercaptopyruvate sulfurtransferase
MSTQRPLLKYLVTPAEVNSVLQQNSAAPRVIPLCASWFLPNDGRNGYETFLAHRIPHARFFDLDAVKDPESPYPHMLPNLKDFGDAMSRLGIERGDTVVVYDTKELGIFSAPRVAWMLKVFGHENVHVLNNFRKWVQDGYPTESGEPKDVQRVEYAVPRMKKDMVVDFEDVRRISQNRTGERVEKVQILDARSQGRFDGVDPEPRAGMFPNGHLVHSETSVLTAAGLSSGHIPHSISIPISDLLDPKDKTFLPSKDLADLFVSKGVDPRQPVIMSCGTGVTAAVIDAALADTSFMRAPQAVYDGSWTEWAQRVKPEEGLIHKSSDKGVNPNS